MYKWIEAERDLYEKFGLVCQLLAEPAQILSYNSLSSAIHLYMIQALVPTPSIFTRELGRGVKGSQGGSYPPFTFVLLTK